MSEPGFEVWLVRHGQTEWSRSLRHTSRTDVALTETGEQQAVALGRLLGGRPFARVLTSPLRRASDTCRLAGYDDRAQVSELLKEWDYGEYEGRTTADIRKERPGWTVWTGAVPDGETVDQVGARARRVIDEVVAAAGDVALFSHGHFLRVLAAVWLGLEPEAGRLFGLDTARLCILGHERETRVISRWNQPARME